MTRTIFQSLPAIVLVLAAWTQSVAQPAPPASAAQPQKPSYTGTELGIAFFQTRCSTCHGNPDGPATAPSPAVIRQMPPERIYAALTSGVMQAHVQDLSKDQIRVLAEFMSGRPMGSTRPGDAQSMPNRCGTNPPLAAPASGPLWNGWGVDVANTRFQTGSAAGIGAADVPRLRLRWAFGFPNGVSAYAQPTLASGRVFTGSDIGYVYALDAATGCVYWSYETGVQVRTAVTIGTIKVQGRDRIVVFFGDLQANVYALDAHDGKLLWRTHVDDHYTARSTAAPTLYDGRLFVPVSSSEGFAAGTADYPCCRFRGSVVALDADTGSVRWKTYTISGENQPSRRNEKGTQLYSPAGVSVWNSPTVDTRRRAIYFGTGDAWTEPAGPTSDAIMALDMDSGKVLWTFQGTTGDVWLGGCFGKQKSAACPAQMGPDNDFGASPILRTLAGGQRVLVVAQKSRNVFALDPDRGGALLWRAEAGTGTRSGVFFGGAADQENVYFGLSDGEVTALRLRDGVRRWYEHLGNENQRVSITAAVSQIPGAVFDGGSDGVLRAHAAVDGKLLWQYNTAREFKTVNGVAAHGGSMRSAGPTIAGGMLFVGSGYGVLGGKDQTGNVLLAFAIE